MRGEEAMVGDPQVCENIAGCYVDSRTDYC